jgi:sugar lactone lactonase YvrE
MDVAVGIPCELGEGPVWLVERRELLWVDILGGSVHSWSPDTGALDTACFGGETSAVVPCDESGYIVAVAHDLLRVEGQLAGQNTTKVIATAEAGLPENRFNDCRCDPQGRLWAGTMSKVRRPAAAGLYRLGGDHELEQVLAGTTISNGIGWSPSGETMYFIDSPSQRIDVYDFDGASGEIAGRRCLAVVDPADGMPDGLAVDSEGGIWVCLFGGGAVRRYTPSGQVDAEIATPVPHPTCPAFGGEDLKTLFITTTRHRLAPEQLRVYPQAGSVFAFEPGVRGQPAHRYSASH